MSVDQQPKDVVALVPIERPETACLGRSEAQAGHFEELSTNAFDKTAWKFRERGTDLSHHGSLLVPAAGPKRRGWSSREITCRISRPPAAGNPGRVRSRCPIIIQDRDNEIATL